MNPAARARDAAPPARPAGAPFGRPGSYPRAGGATGSGRSRPSPRAPADAGTRRCLGSAAPTPGPLGRPAGRSAASAMRWRSDPGRATDQRPAPPSVEIRSGQPDPAPRAGGSSGSGCRRASPWAPAGAGARRRLGSAAPPPGPLGRPTGRSATPTAQERSDPGRATDHLPAPPPAGTRSGQPDLYPRAGGGRESARSRPSLRAHTDAELRRRIGPAALPPRHRPSVPHR